MATESGITRRQLMHTSLAWAGLATVAPLGSVLAAEDNKWVLTEVTPATVLGPFYPWLNKPTDPRTDPSMIKNGTAPAQEQLLYLMGPARDVTGPPPNPDQVRRWPTH